MNPLDDDFYEEDEPLEDVIAAFDRGEKGLTIGPKRLDGAIAFSSSSSVTIEHCWFSSEVPE